MNNFIVDGHSDILLNYWRNKNYNFGEENENVHVDLPKLRRGKLGLEVFAVCSAAQGCNALQKTIRMVDKFLQLEKKYDGIEMIKNYYDIKKIIDQDNIAALLSIEGADGIFDLSALRLFYNLGVRLITLTWNYRNHIADGIKEIDANGGVTEFGKKFINEMNKLGMIIDVSHLTPSSFWDVIKYSKNPIVASHSNVKNICNHPRNLTDDQIKAIAQKDGIIGINFCPQFLINSNRKEAEIKDVIKHIDYIKNLVGIKYIGLGTDYDGIEKTPRGLSNIAKLPDLFKNLKEHGYTKKEIDYIMRNNWLRVLKEII